MSRDPALLPSDEDRRLEVLQSYQILDTPPEASFDDLARLAARICGTRVAVVSFVDADRVWFKARLGLEVSEVPREGAFCDRASAGTGLFLVPDAARDERFRASPLVASAPEIRFYAGAPLVAPDGYVLGVLGVMDRVPHELDPGQQEALRALSRQVVAQLEIRRHIRQLERTLAEVARAEDVLRRTMASPPTRIEETGPRGGGRGRMLVAVAAALIPTLLTLWGFSVSLTSAERARRARFEREVAQVGQSIRERMDAYEQVLRGTGALLAASPSVERGTWRAYVHSLAVPEHFFGIKGVGYAARVRPEERASFEAAARVDGAPGFAVWPPGERTEYLPTLYFEPPAANEGVLGFDVGSEPERRAAAERARDTGQPTLTGKVRLVPDPDPRPGVLLFLPVYRGGQPRGTVEERRAALRGWVYAAFRAADLTQRLPVRLLPELDLEIFDGLQVAPEAMLLDEDPTQGRSPSGTLETTSRLEVSGRTWTLHFATRPPFDEATRSREPWVILVGGLLASGLILGFVVSLTSTQRRALALSERMTAALRKSEGHVRALVDNIADGLVTYSEGGAIESWNRAAERLFGYPPSAVLGQSIEMLIPTAAEELKDGFHSEARGRRADGATFPIDLAVSRLRHGEHSSFIAIMRDITGPKRADRQRAAQHAVTRILAESLTIEDAAPHVLGALGEALAWECGAFWAVQREAHVLRCVATWNAPAFRAHAFLAACSSMTLAPGLDLAGEVWRSGALTRVADLRERPHFPRATLALREGLRAALGLPIALGREVLGVLEFFGGTAEAPGEELAPLLAAVGGQIAQFVERAESDKALRSGDERTRAVIENMLEGLIAVNERGIIESVNPAAERMFGYAAWELVGQHLKILMPQSVAARAEPFLRDAVPRALGRLTEWEGRRRSGELFRFELSLFEFQTPEGRHFAGHIRDVSDRMKLERMKQEFVATVSHELRTPLTSIRGSLSLLASGVLGELPDEAREVVGIAERNTVRLVALINDILDLERLEMGKMEMHFASVPAATVLERSLDSVRAFADQQGVRLEAPPLPATVFGDADRLVQVLVNLLSNAVKFSPRGETVTASAEEQGDGVEFRVVDRGRGIPVSHHAAIFERFKQVQASDSREKGGTGLGLAICKAIVEQHGGTIGVTSAPGQGSTFWFRVPSRPPAGETRPADEDHLLEAVRGSASETPSRDVLLADDDEALLGVMTRQLLQHGIAVRAAKSGREAILQALRHPPALLVVDVGLPDRDGFAVIEALRHEPHLRGLPVLVYTGRDLTAEQRERLTLGPTRFLTKSRATDEEFQSLVSDLLRDTQGPGGGT